MKPEAVWEVESGLKLSAYDITAASAVRSEWYHAVRRFFERYDYFVVPTAQLFPFPIDLTWPREIDGTRMTTYHEWMKGVLPVTMAGSPALAVPAGFGAAGLADRHPDRRAEPRRVRLPAARLCLRPGDELGGAAPAADVGRVIAAGGARAKATFSQTNCHRPA